SRAAGAAAREQGDAQSVSLTCGGSGGSTRETDALAGAICALRAVHDLQAICSMERARRRAAPPRGLLVIARWSACIALLASACGSADDASPAWSAVFTQLDRV